MIYSFDVSLSSLSGVNWPQLIGQISRPSVEQFQSECAMGTCGHGTEIVEPFYVEVVDADSGRLSVSVSVLGSFVYSDPDAQRLALERLAGIIGEQIHQASGRDPVVTYQGGAIGRQPDWATDPLYRGIDNAWRGTVLPSLDRAGAAVSGFFRGLSRTLLIAGVVLVVLVVISE